MPLFSLLTDDHLSWNSRLLKKWLGNIRTCVDGNVGCQMALAFYEKAFSTTLDYTRSSIFDPIRAIIASCLRPLFGP